MSGAMLESEVTVPEEPATWATLAHHASNENSFDDNTYVDHPLANDNPNVVLVTQVQDTADEINQ